jgi:hypothetical protein
MYDGAAHLVDRVIPAVPVRQWVLTFPFSLRVRLAYDAELVTKVLALFVRSVSRFYEVSAARHGLAGGKTGSVTAIQRFGSALNLNPHFHCLFLDGVFHRKAPVRPLRFQSNRGLDDADVRDVLEDFGSRLNRLVVRLGLNCLDDDGSQESESPMTQLALQSIAGRGVAARLGTEPDPPSAGRSRGPRLCVADSGFTLHARTRVAAPRRGDLEVLCRYILRPPLAAERVQWSGGEVELDLPRPWADGTRVLRFTPTAFLRRLVPLIPAPRRNLVRYHGVLAPAAPWRAEVVAGATTAGGLQRPHSPHSAHRPAGQTRPRRLDWAELLRRTYLVDLLRCQHCGGRRVVLAMITMPSVIAAILSHLDLRPRPPPRHADLPTHPVQVTLQVR